MGMVEVWWCVEIYGLRESACIGNFRFKILESRKKIYSMFGKILASF